MKLPALLLSTLLLTTGCMNHFAAVQQYQAEQTKKCMEKYHDAKVCAPLPYPSEEPR